MRRPLIALTVAASVFSLVAAGATGYQVNKAVDSDILLTNSYTGNVEYNITDTPCDDTFTVDYTLSGTSLSTVDVAEATDSCLPTYTGTTLAALTPTSIQIDGTYSTGYFEVFSDDARLIDPDNTFITVSGLSGSGIVDGTYRRVAYSGGAPISANYSLVEGTAVTTASLTSGFDTVTLLPTRATYEMKLETEVYDIDSDQWIDINDDEGVKYYDWNYQTHTFSFSGATDLNTSSKLRLTASLVPIDWS